MAPPPPFGANSAAARDIANVLHPYTDLEAHQQVGPVMHQPFDHADCVGHGHRDLKRGDAACRNGFCHPQYLVFVVATQHGHDTNGSNPLQNAFFTQGHTVLISLLLF